MKKYCIIFMNRVLVQLTYKFNLLTQLMNHILGIIVAAFTWLAIFNSTTHVTIGGFTQAQMLFYIIAANISAVLFSTEHVVMLGTLVRMGKLTTHLLRPYSILLQSFAEYLGNRFLYIIFYLMAIAVSLIIGYETIYSMHLLIFLGCNLIMFFFLTSWIGTLGFWLIQMWPLRAVMNAVYALLGGLLFPLNLLPEVLYDVLSKNPFALVAYQYTLALQHGMTLTELQLNCLYSIAWAVVGYTGYRWSFGKGLLHYEGMGA